MTGAEAVQLAHEALWLVLVLSAPPMLAAALAGLAMALVQAVTQLQEQTIQYTVKFVAIVVTLLATGTLAGGALVRFAERIFTGFFGMLR